jgi:hypothetical protein
MPECSVQEAMYLANDSCKKFTRRSLDRSLPSFVLQSADVVTESVREVLLGRLMYPDSPVFHPRKRGLLGKCSRAAMGLTEKA